MFAIYPFNYRDVRAQLKNKMEESGGRFKLGERRIDEQPV